MKKTEKWEIDKWKNNWVIETLDEILESRNNRMVVWNHAIVVCQHAMIQKNNKTITKLKN